MKQPVVDRLFHVTKLQDWCCHCGAGTFTAQGVVGTKPHFPPFPAMFSYRPRVSSQVYGLGLVGPCAGLGTCILPPLVPAYSVCLAASAALSC